MRFMLFLTLYSKSCTIQLNQQLVQFLKVGALLLLLITGVLSQLFATYPEPRCTQSLEEAREEVYYVSEGVRISSYYVQFDNKKTIDDFQFRYFTYVIDEDTGEEVETNDVDFDIDEIDFTMEPYATLPGEYMVLVEVSQVGGIEGLGKTYKCYFVILAEDPEAIIEGGSSRIVAPNVDFVVDGSESNNVNHKEVTNEGLTYLWTCTQLLTPPTFCKGDWTSTKERLTIPAKHVVDEDEFVFTLKVSTEWDTHDNASQKIYVLKNSVNLVLKCHKNCPPVAAETVTGTSTFLEASCRQSCKFVTDNDLVWTIISKTNPKFTFNYKTGTRFGRQGRKFVIKENVLKPGIYNISVTLKAGHKRKGYSSMIIEYVGSPEVKDCQVTPKKGESLKTSFSFKCVQSPPNQRNHYKLEYVDTKDSSKTVTVTEGYYPDVFGEKFVLPPSTNKKLELTITLGSHKPTTVLLNVEVTPGLTNKPSTEVIKIVNNLYSGTTQSQSIKELAKSSDPVERKKAMQIMTSLVEELTDTKNDDPVFNDFIRTLKIQATKDLLDTPATRASNILKIGETLTRLNDFKSPPQTDTEIAKIATSVCDTITDKMLKVMQKKKNVLTMSDKSKSLARFVSRCLKSHAKENLKILEPVKLNVSSRFPPAKKKVDQSVLTESYPDYEDHGPNYYNDLNNLRNATGKTLNASMKMAKALAFTTAIGEGVIKTEGEYDTTLVLKDLGKEIAVTKLASDGVVLIPSQDFANETHSFDVLLTIWKQDILWWNPNHTCVATNIAIVQFWHSTCKKRIYEFFQPVEIFFAKRPGFVFAEKTRNRTFRILKDCGRSSCPQVLQFAVPKRRTLHVQFFAFSQTSSLKFITTYFKFPTMDDFGNGTVNEFDSLNTSFVNRKDYDVLVYVGIVSVDNKSSTPIKYNVHSKVTNCIRWSMKANQWKLTCYPGDNGNSTMVDCMCYHFSAIAGYFENIKFLEKAIQAPNLKLKLVSNQIICITVAVTMFLFCSLLLLILLPKKKINVYYLADNNTKHRFAYLLTVKTGFRVGAGTSSNVTIKLHGAKKSSEPHVLNYPDPKKSLLQSFGEDMFLLSTESSLGELKEMELWFDSLGVNPTWRCRDIYVFDMQQHNEWRFKVETKFSVVKGITYCAVQPFREEKSILLNKNKLNLSQRFHVWNLCQKEEHISYLQKLTIILSTLLTIYFLTLLCYGLPEILLRDCLDTYVALEVNDFTVLVAFVSSFSAFVLHSFLIWGFRLSKFQKWKNDTVAFILTIACWSLLIGLIIISTTFLTVYGFWVPYYSSLCWLISCLIGIAFDIFLYEIIFAVIQNLFMKNSFKKHNVIKLYQYILQTSEYQRKYLRSKFGNMILRPYFKHLYKPIKKKRFKKVQKWLIHRYSIISEFEDLLMFSIYIVILYVVVLANKDRLMVVSKNDMRDLLTGLHTRSITFENLDELEKIYEYINLTLIEVLHASEWYDNFSIYEPALMKDVANKYLGVVRMRQQRIEPNACEVAPRMRFLNTSCWPEYSIRFLETKTFGVGWKQSVNNPIAATHDRLRNVWKYQTGAEAGSSPAIGEFATYTGGGYIYYLGRKAYNSVANFLRMFQDEWINPETRVIFIEFMSYNQNFNVFNSIRLMIEQSASGYILRDVSVSLTKKYIFHRPHPANIP
ncbi:uncharacterized protein LOC107398588 [Tribolium castaneum]|uniref:uncharacterized protein LOC107398588 n=1 Tax=Tribolium castaneum TaxID=7070 RepID=UPI0030FF3E80